MDFQFNQWWHIALALTPVILLIVLMGFLKLSGDKSAVITLISSIIIAIFAFGYPLKDSGTAVLIGILGAIFPILIIIIMALFSYNVLLHTGKMEVIKAQFTGMSSDKCLQVLLLTWGFGGLLEGMAGFGTAVAIPAAILISLGFRPIFSATVSLIANSVATGFGAVGTPVITLANLTGISGTPDGTQILSSQIILQLSPLMFIIPFVLLFLTDPRIKALPKNLLIAVIVGGVSLVTQYVAARYMGHETPAILGSIASIIVIIIYAKLTATAEDRQLQDTMPKYTMGQSLQAWSVYGLILILVILTSPLFPIKAFLGQVNTPITLDILDAVIKNDSTGLYYSEVVQKVIKIEWLVNAGTLLFLGSFFGGLIQGAKVTELFALLWKVFKQQYKTIITVCSLIAFSSVMGYSGMTYTIGYTLAGVTGAFYPLFAPAIGCLGTFLTGSDTSANILFGKLQTAVAKQIGVDPSWLAAANTAGATGGKIISPQSIAIATSACHLQGSEGEILKKALPYAIAYIVVAGLMVYAFSIPATL